MKYTKEDLIDDNIINNLLELGDDGDNAFLKEILNLYNEQYPELFENIKQSFESNESLKLSQAAHALKGASLNIGAKAVAEVCKEMEMKGKAGDLTGISVLIEKLTELYKHTFTEFEKL